MHKNLDDFLQKTEMKETSPKQSIHCVDPYVFEMIKVYQWREQHSYGSATT